MNISLRVRDGADLMTRPSSDEVGPSNYVVKRDWRTELDQEVRREGDSMFAPRGGGDPFPSLGTNLISPASELDNAAWSLTNLTLTIDGARGVDGTQTADLVSGSGTGLHHATRLVTITAGGLYLFSTAVRQSLGYKGRIVFGDATFGAVAVAATYDLMAGTVVAEVIAGSPLAYAVDIQRVYVRSDGALNTFFRIMLAARLDVATTAAAVRLQLADSFGAYSFTGSNSRYFWDTKLCPAEGTLTLVFTARQDNGKTALIVGTPTSLYRYYGYEDDAVVESEVFADNTTLNLCSTTWPWLQIGSGFNTSSLAHRWEAKNVGGYTVFNNGPDTVRYHLNDYATRPMYELREQGICFVGAIEEVSGILVCMDVGVIHEDYLETVMDSTAYAAYTDESHFDRIHYRVVWGDPLGPLRWGASVPGAMTAGGATLTLDYEVTSMQPGDSIRVVGAGTDGGDLLTTLGYKSGTGIWILNDAAETTVSDAAVALQDAANLIVGSFDCLDDATPIIRGVKVSDRLIICKASGFILGEYTGDRALPFIFSRIYSGNEGVFWRWTAIENNNALIYAGEQDFYTFDLVNRQPRQHPKLTLCRDLFFGPVAALSASQDSVYVADNGLTKELWFVFPSTGYSDAALAYDYRRRELGGDRCQTISAVYSACGTIDMPTEDVVHGAAGQRFIMASTAGLLQYGMDQAGPTIWTRIGSEYASDLWPGIADFGDPTNEKHLAQYLLLLASQSPTASISIGFFAVRNPGETLTEISGSPITFATPLAQNTAYFHQLFHLIQERIRVTGTANVRISKRVWGIGQQGGASMDRR